MQITKIDGPKKLVVYHGTGSRFQKFNLKKSTMGLMWFSSSKEAVLSGDVGADGRGWIATAEVTIQKAAGWEEYEKLFIDELKSQGYDGGILPNGNGFDCFVFDPSQVCILKWEKV
jgi:hypothetical protein